MYPCSTIQRRQAMLAGSEDSIQIHHTGHSHWVTSFQRTGDNRVFLLDSLLLGPELPASLQIQLAQIYGSSNNQLLVDVPHLSKTGPGIRLWPVCHRQHVRIMQRWFR